MTGSDLSARASPPSATDEEGIDDAQANGLRLELAPFGLEQVFDYEPGGHHPVHLGDVLGDTRKYRVIHKLGNGGFANIWLCRDLSVEQTTTYVALKIFMADPSTDDCPELLVNTRLPAGGNEDSHIARALDEFKLHSPNGTHLCFVYPVFGPKVSLGLFSSPKNPDEVLRRICRQAVEAMDFLHSNGICHGDFTPNNILHRLAGLDGLAEAQVLEILGQPRQNKVLNAAGEPPSEPTAPKYLVYPIKWGKIESQHVTDQACLIDFGESFEVSSPPEDLGTPGPYRSPELILDKKAGIGSDLWALGCTLFEIRTGRALFKPFDDEDDDYLEAMVTVLGPLPEPWWSTTWEGRNIMFKDAADDLGRAVSTVETADADQGRNIHPSVADGARSLQDKLAPGLWYMSDERGAGDDHRDIPPEEQELFADLLAKLLNPSPEGRVSARDALSHGWFQL